MSQLRTLENELADIRARSKKLLAERTKLSNIPAPSKEVLAEIETLRVSINSCRKQERKLSKIISEAKR